MLLLGRRIIWVLYVEKNRFYCENLTERLGKRFGQNTDFFALTLAVYTHSND